MLQNPWAVLNTPALPFIDSGIRWMHAQLFLTGSQALRRIHPLCDDIGLCRARQCMSWRPACPLSWAVGRTSGLRSRRMRWARVRRATLTAPCCACATARSRRPPPPSTTTCARARGVSKFPSGDQEVLLLRRQHVHAQEWRGRRGQCP